MRVQLRIVAGSLRGRKLTCSMGPEFRPTPQRVREALFSILGVAVPGRPFVDVFAGSGVIGLEALSRGAQAALFIERDFRLAQEIDRHAREFAFAAKAKVLRADVYRWAAGWAPHEPVNVFVSPPFVDIQQRTENFLLLVNQLQAKMPEGSVLILQSERHSVLEGHEALKDWDERHYGRNVLLIWEPANTTAPEEETSRR